MQSGIYRIRNAANSKVYVGSAVNLAARWRQHLSLLRRGLHHSVKLQRAWNKYGESAFDFTVLEYAPGDSQLVKVEQRWIDQVRPEYNIAKKAGSRLGVPLGAEARAKMSAVRIGKRPTEETRQKMSAWQLGRKRSEETCLKISESKKAANLKGRPAWNKGAKHSDETRAKMRAAHALRRQHEAAA